MSKEKAKQPKPRITSWIRTNFGEEILAEIVSGKRKITLNGTKLDAKASNFRDKRVTKTSQIEIIPEPKVLYQDTSSKIVETLRPKDKLPSKEIVELHKKYVEKKKEKKEPEPERKTYVKDFLTNDQISSITSGKANLFVDGLASDMMKEIEADNDTNPMINGKVVVIKVLPKFRGG